jgi:hypothetical protein
MILTFVVCTGSRALWKHFLGIVEQALGALMGNSIRHPKVYCGLLQQVSSGWNRIYSRVQVTRMES